MKMIPAPDVIDAPCPGCGSVGLRVEWRADVSQPEQEWPWAVCSSCHAETFVEDMDPGSAEPLPRRVTWAINGVCSVVIAAAVASLIVRLLGGQ